MKENHWYSLRLVAAIGAARVAHWIARASGRGGTALPGLVAERICPDIIARLSSRLRRGTVLITGTNGKTTTTAMVANMLRAGGLQPIHNRSGSNLSRGIATTLVNAAAAGLLESERSIGIFEVDEAALAPVAAAARPRVVVFANLFRDQLDRYAELDTVAKIWRTTIEKLLGATVVLNADDPLIGALPVPPKGRRLYFGLGDVPAPEHSGTADSVWCPECGARLMFRRIWYSHLGDYSCSACGHERPARDYSAVSKSVGGLTGSDVSVTSAAGTLRYRLRVPGLYNVYNSLAALAGGIAAGVPSPIAVKALDSFSAAFGRTECFRFGGREVVLLLVKNPTGYDQALQTILAQEAAPNLLVALNDDIADGRDVSWIWDVDFEQLAGREGAVTVTGERGADLAVRLKYAGLPPVSFPGPDLGTALDAALRSSSEILYVLPTYTAMLTLHKLLAEKGGRPQFWQESRS